MCDPGSRKRKLRPNTSLESSKTVKGIFKKDDLDDSLSTSEWGTLMNDHQLKRRNNYVKLEEEPLTLICEWDNCCQAFTEYVPYNNHVMQHLDDCCFLEGDESFQCFWIDCTYTAPAVAFLRQHACYHAYHSKLKSVGKNVENRAKLPNCTHDYFQIPEMKNGYLCEWEYCHQRFQTIFDFLEHIRIHVYHNPTSRKEGVIKCCWKGCTNQGKFPSQYKLSEHLRKHTQEKIIACPTCGNLFSNKTKFCDHRRRQLPIDLQSYLCSQCSKYFPSERLLRDHMRLHINHYKCSMCEMTCPKPSILAKHIRYRHSTEKPYKCNQCSYRCVSKHNLDYHLKKHDPESQYQCKECGYECRSSFGLERHLQKRHGKDWNNVYECHNCQKRFIRGGHLTKHLMKVHNYHWPSGHSRFRYKEDQDGIYRLQTVRYETLDVTEEIIKGKMSQAPLEKESFKFKVLKRDRVDENAVDTFDIVFTKETEEEPTKKVVITIDDIDSKGNVLKSQTIQSSEVICNDMSEIASDNVTDSDKIIIVKPTNKQKRRASKRKRRS